MCCKPSLFTPTWRPRNDEAPERLPLSFRPFLSLPAPANTRVGGIALARAGGARPIPPSRRYGTPTPQFPSELLTTVDRAWRHSPPTNLKVSPGRREALFGAEASSERCCVLLVVQPACCWWLVYEAAAAATVLLYYCNLLVVVCVVLGQSVVVALCDSVAPVSCSCFPCCCICGTSRCCFLLQRSWICCCCCCFLLYLRLYLDSYY